MDCHAGLRPSRNDDGSCFLMNLALNHSKISKTRLPRLLRKLAMTVESGHYKKPKTSYNDDRNCFYKFTH